MIRSCNPVNAHPALVTQRAVQRLPRLALLLFCAAYVLPGVFGRDPWRNADIRRPSPYMLAMAEGRTSWLRPSGRAAGSIPPAAALARRRSHQSLLSPWLDPALAARMPFALLLALVPGADLVRHLPPGPHRSRAAGGLCLRRRSRSVDYARAMADGALLALIATLGLLQLGHETTPELVQLFAASLALWSLAAAPYRPATCAHGRPWWRCRCWRQRCADDGRCCWAWPAP